MLIDAHIHVGLWDHPDFLGRSCNVADVCAVLDACNIAGAAIMPTDRCENQALLDEARAAIRGGWSGSLWMFGWFRPNSAENPEFADLDWVSDNADALTGIKIHPSLSRKRITDPAFAPVLDVAASRDLIVLVHCGRWQEIASYRFAIEAAERYPTVRFVLGHAGGDTPPLATAAAELVAARNLSNVWFEISGLREYWVVERNVAKYGADRYLMGSDYGLAHPMMYISQVRGMNISESDKAKILGKNAVALFGRPLS